MSESFITDFENICSWLAQFVPIRCNLHQNLVQFAPIGCNLCQIVQFVPIGRNLCQSGTICTKLHNFSTIAPLDIKWRVRCSKTWALLLYYYSRFLHASIIVNMGEGGAQKLLAWPGFEAHIHTGVGPSPNAFSKSILMRASTRSWNLTTCKQHELSTHFIPPKCSAIMFSRRSVAIESDHIGWHENEKKRRRNRWLIWVSFLVPIKHVCRNIMIIIGPIQPAVQSLEQLFCTFLGRYICRYIGGSKKLFMYLVWMFVMTWWRMEAKLMSWPKGMNGCKVIPEWNTLISPGFCGSNARPKGSLLFPSMYVRTTILWFPLQYVQ